MDDNRRDIAENGDVDENAQNENLNADMRIDSVQEENGIPESVGVQEEAAGMPVEKSPVDDSQAASPQQEVPPAGIPPADVPHMQGAGAAGMQSPPGPPVYGPMGTAPAAKADGDGPKLPFFKNKIFIIAMAVLVALGIASIPVTILYRSYCANYIEENIALDDDQFALSGQFYLEGMKGVSANYLAQNLKIDPPLPFHVYKDGKDRLRISTSSHKNIRYELTLSDPFKGNMYVFDLNDYVLTVRMITGNLDDLPVGEKLVLQFSDVVSVAELNQKLAISPRVDFIIRTKDKTATILPRHPLDFSTTYKLTVFDDFVSENGRMLAREYEVHFTTEPDVVIPLSYASSRRQIIDSQMPLNVDVVGEYGASDCGPVTVEMYKYRDTAQFLENGNALATADITEDIFEKVYTQDQGAYNVGVNTITMENPGHGGYLLLVEAVNPKTGKEFTLRKTVFVTDMSVYMQTNQAQTLVWLNDGTATGPLSGYTVEFTEEDSDKSLVDAVTDETGVAVMVYAATEDNTPRKDMRIKAPDGTLVYSDSTAFLNQYYSAERNDRYYTYLFTDRTLYHPTDEINFWGYIKAYSHNPDPTPTTMEIVMDEEGLNQRMTVNVSEDGTFHGVMKLEQVRSSQYSLVLRLPQKEGETEDDRWSSRVQYVWFEVKDFTKPMFKISSQVDKLWYNYDEDVTVSVTPTFYDGTPLPDYELEFTIFNGYYGDQNPVQKIRTNEKGVATITFPAYQMRDTTHTWQPVGNRYMIRIASDGENVTSYGTYTYFPSSVMLEAKIVEQSDKNARLELTANKIDLSKIRADDDAFHKLMSGYYGYYDGYAYDEGKRFDIIRGEAITTTANADVYAYYYTKSGRWREQDESKDVAISGGTGVLSSVVKSEFDAEDYVSLNTYARIDDPKGGRVTAAAYWSNYRYRWGRYEEGEQPLTGYSLRVTDGEGNNKTGAYYEYMTYNNSRFGNGELMKFELMDGIEPATGSGKLLYTIIQDDIIDRKVLDGNTFSLTQKTDYANNICVTAAFFDGRQVRAVRDTQIEFDQSSMELTVEATPDRESYRPGEPVTIDISTVDKDGNPIAANVCVSVVDEAIFALQEQYVNALSDLYGRMYFYNYNVSKYTSLTGDIYYGGGGDGGKGDGADLEFYDSIRKNFKDTAHFAPVKTDASGKARVQFTLPDNTTSWRTTTVAISDGLYAGNSKTNFIATLPFFVTPVMSNKYITGDDFAMLVQGHGILLKADSEIEYSVTVTGDKYNKTMTAKNLAYNANQLNFGKLEAGEYLVSATAKIPNYSDTVQLPLYVVDSNLELVINKQIDLQKPMDITAVRYPVTMSFYDQEYQPYYESISSLMRHYCMGASQRMSRFVAKRSLTKYMEKDQIPNYIREGNNDAADMQNDDGGIGWYRGELSDPILTAKVLMVARDQFDLPRMTYYFRDVLNETDDEHVVTACYLGLAVIGEDVKADITKMLADEKTSLYGQAYLISGLAYLDEAAAKIEYDKTLAPLLKTSGTRGKYLAAPGTDDWNSDMLTAAGWIAASKLHLVDADEFSLYFSAYKWRISSLFECMVYITHFDKEVQSRTFTYESEGQEHKVDLGVRGQKTISFNKSQFTTLKFTDVPKNIMSMAYFIGEPSEVDITPSELITFEKKITPIGDNNYRISLIVDLDQAAPAGFYDISEWIPSNMRLYKMEYPRRYSNDYWWYDYLQEGQKLYFQVYVSNNNKPRRVLINYIARKTYESEAMFDSAYIIHGDSGANAFTPRSKLDLSAPAQTE